MKIDAGTVKIDATIVVKTYLEVYGDDYIAPGVAALTAFAWHQYGEVVPQSAIRNAHATLLALAKERS